MSYRVSLVLGQTVSFNTANSMRIYFSYSGTDKPIKDLKVAYNHGPTVIWHYNQGPNTWVSSFTSKNLIDGMFFPSDSVVGWNESKEGYVGLHGQYSVPTNTPLNRLSTLLLIDLSKNNGYLDVIPDNSGSKSYRLSPAIPIRRLLKNPVVHGETTDIDFGKIKFSIEHTLMYDLKFPILNYELRAQLADILIYNPEDVKIMTKDNQDITSLFSITVDDDNHLTIKLKSNASINVFEKSEIFIEIASTVNDTKDLSKYIETIDGIQYITTSHTATAFVNVGSTFEQILHSNEGVSQVPWPITEGEVNVRYLDEKGNELASSEKLNGQIGEEYKTNPKDIKGYQVKIIPENSSGIFTEEVQTVIYVYVDDSVAPVDPLNPEAEVSPNNPTVLPEKQGLLSIDFVSSFNFGSQPISVNDQTYYAQPQRLLNEDGTVNETEERPNYVQISDRRPENDRNGWQLAVTQNDPFLATNNRELNGARLRLTNQQLATAQGGSAPEFQQTNPLALVPGNRRILLMAQGTEGTGTWIYRFGDQETANKSVALDVPKGANPEATRYETTLTWELSAVPDN